MAEWSEADHPRDDSGRFAGGGDALGGRTPAQFRAHLAERAAEMAQLDKEREQRQAVSHYTQAGYSSINSQLREATGDLTDYRVDDDVKTYVARMDEVIERSPDMDLRGVEEVWRGVGSEVDLDRLSPGDTMTDHAYQSTSTDRELVQSFREQLMRIEVPGDLRAADGAASESELILPRGGTLEYVGREDVEAGYNSEYGSAGAKSAYVFRWTGVE